MLLNEIVTTIFISITSTNELFCTWRDFLQSVAERSMGSQGYTHEYKTAAHSIGGLL